MNTTLSFRRIIYLLRNEIWIKWRLYAMLLAIAFLTSIIVYLSPSHDITEFQALTGSSNIQSTRTFVDASGRVTTTYNGYDTSSLKYHLNWFPQLLFLIGCLFASLSFWEYRPGNSRSFHLNLPSTKTEKWLAKAILTIVLFPLAFLIFYQLYASITYALGPDQGVEFVRIGWFDPYIWKYLGYYIIIQSFFVLGGIIFTKYSAVKSIIALSLLLVSKKIVIALGLFLKTGELHSSSGGNSSIPWNIWSPPPLTSNNSLLYILDHKTWPYSIWFWGVLFISISMLIVYYKFQELES